MPQKAAGLVTGFIICLVAVGGGGLPAEATTPPNCSVDAAIAPLGKPFVGIGVVDPLGTSQTVRVRAHRTQLRLFLVDVTNTGTETDPFVLSASVLAPSTSVTISDGSADVTGDARSGVYASASVGPGQTHEFVIWMRPYSTGPFGDIRSVSLSTTCKGIPASPDTVIAEIAVRR